MRVGKVMKVGHRLGGDVGGVHQASFEGKKVVASELSECKRTGTHFQYPLEKSLEAKLRKEFLQIFSRISRSTAPIYTTFSPSRSLC